MRRYGILGLAIAALFMVAGAPLAEAGGVKPKIKYKYYRVSGDTSLDIVKSMLRKGPKVKDGHAYATAAIRVTSNAKEDHSQGCKVKDLTFNANITITLPKHRSRASLSPDVRKNYDKLSRKLKSHEEEHRDIFLSCLRRMHKQIMRLPAASSCSAYAKKVDAITEREWARCDRLNAAIDKRDGRIHDRLPLIAQALGEASTKRNAAYGSRRATGSVAVEFDPTLAGAR